MNGINTVLTADETRALCVELIRLFNNGFQNTLSWKTREELTVIITNFIAIGLRPDIGAITKEGLIFILNIVPEYDEYYVKLFKTIRKRAYKAIEYRTQKHYNM